MAALDPQEFPRESYLVATKVGRYGEKVKDFDYSRARVRHSVQESLARMGLEYLDIVYVHDVEFLPNEAVNTALPELFSLQVRQGITMISRMNHVQGSYVL